LLVWNPEKIRQIKSVCPGSRIVRDLHRCIHVNVDFFEADLSRLVSIDAFMHWKFRRYLQAFGGPIAATLEDIDCEVVLHSIKTLSIPVAKLSVFIEKSDGPPFAFFGNEVRAPDWPCCLENVLEVRIAEAAENQAKLIKKAGSVFF